MSRSIFIFSNIVVYFLIIVSKIESKAAFVYHENFSVQLFQNYPDTVIFFQEDFERANLQEWEQTTDWEVSDLGKISGNYSLKHSGNATSGISSVFHPLKTDMRSHDLQWSFRLKNGNWDPSSSNRFWFYCCADTIQPEQLSGWAVGVNITGSSDLLELWRFKNGKADSLIIQTDLDWDASTTVLLNAKKTARGLWSLAYQKTGQALSKTFEGTDKSFLALQNIGVYFNYTSTRIGQLWIDDILVTGTPAQPFIEKIELITSQLIQLTFNKPILPTSIQSTNFRITGESGQSVAVSNVSPTKGRDTSIDINIAKANVSELHLSVSGISDLSGQIMQPETHVFSYSFAPEKGTVLINEVLFNPFTGGVDFVELVNFSEFSVPVHRLKLATRDDTLALKQIYSVSTEKRFLKPGEFLVCTKDPMAVIAQYISNNPESFCTTKSFPTYSDDAGIVVLLNDSLDVVDEFSYSAKMHSPFLADEEGVSLERISLEKPASDLKNWASAAASVGFATPGLPNSQTQSETEIQDKITCEPKAFSPNGDGYNDELMIKYNFSKPGYIANVRLFDVAGRQVKFLIKNQSQAQEGSWMWDGKNESGQKLGIGVYIVLVEVFDDAGISKKFKTTLTLTDKLD